MIAVANVRTRHIDKSARFVSDHFADGDDYSFTFSLGASSLATESFGTFLNQCDDC